MHCQFQVVSGGVESEARPVLLKAPGVLKYATSQKSESEARPVLPKAPGVLAKALKPRLVLIF